ERSGFAFGESAQFAGAALEDSAGNLIGERRGFCAGALRIGKNVKIGERKRLDETKRRGVVVFRLTGKTGNDVGADGGMRKALADKFDAARVMPGAIPTVHGSKDAIGAGLQRHVEMLREALG